MPCIYDSTRFLVSPSVSAFTPRTLRFRFTYGDPPDRFIDEPVMRAGNQHRYYHRGQQYSVTALTDSSGNVTERYAYTAYGTPTITDGAGATLTTSADNNRYTYTGREWDETLSLYHYRARMYDSISGRFLGRDPIGYLVDGPGLYLYVSSKPLVFVDSTGNSPEQPPNLPQPLGPQNGGNNPAAPPGNPAAPLGNPAAGPGLMPIAPGGGGAANDGITCALSGRAIGGARPLIPELSLPAPNIGRAVCYDFTWARTGYKKVKGRPIALIPYFPFGCSGATEGEVDRDAETLFSTGQLQISCLGFSSCKRGCKCESVFSIPHTSRLGTGWFAIPLLRRPCVAVVVVTYKETYSLNVGLCKK